MILAHESQLLDELLTQSDLRARIVFRGLACERWAIGGGRQGRLGFHVVLSGRCWLRLRGAITPVEMTEGGLLLYRPEAWHLLSDSTTAAKERMPVQILPVSSEARGAHVGLLCGYLEGGANLVPLFDALPPYMSWPGFDSFSGTLALLMRALTASALDPTRSDEHLQARLCELVVLTTLRNSTVLKPEAIAVLRAQCDPALRRAFEVMRARPGRGWTLAALARHAGLSRSAFAVRFKEQAQIPAMRYLRRYRVALAERRVREEGLSLDRAARAVGFGSARALRRAARSVRR